MSQTSTPFRLDRIGQIHIGVADIDRAVAFYRDVLGMTLLFQVPGQPMAFFDCGGVRLYLGRPEGGGFRSNPLLYYQVNDLAAACAALEARGVTFEHPAHMVHRAADHDLWMAGFRDPDNNYLHLMSEVAH